MTVGVIWLLSGVYLHALFVRFNDPTLTTLCSSIHFV